MGKPINAAFGRLTSIPRKLNVLPENAKTPQGTADILRGKTAPEGNSFFGSGMASVGRSSRTLLGTEKKKDAKGRSLSK